MTSEKLKKEIHKIMLDAVSGRNERYTYRQAGGGKYVRLGLVALDIDKAIDEIIGGQDDPA